MLLQIILVRDVALKLLKQIRGSAINANIKTPRSRDGTGRTMIIIIIIKERKNQRIVIIVLVLKHNFGFCRNRCLRRLRKSGGGQALIAPYTDFVLQKRTAARCSAIYPGSYIKITFRLTFHYTQWTDKKTYLPYQLNVHSCVLFGVRRQCNINSAPGPLLYCVRAFENRLRRRFKRHLWIVYN